MTWTKLSDDFGDDCARVGLSDAAFRTHVEGQLWSNRRETDGRLPRKDLKRFAECDDPESAVKELVDCKYWVCVQDGWRIAHSQDNQIEAAVLAKRRADNAERSRQHRRRKVGLDAEDAPSHDM